MERGLGNVGIAPSLRAQWRAQAGAMRHPPVQTLLMNFLYPAARNSQAGQVPQP
jgi:hypothetical protein